jgi:hypothetical protein
LDKEDRMEARKGIATWLDKLQAAYGKKTKEQAAYYAALTDISEDVKVRMEDPKAALLKAGETIYLEDERRKVAYQPEVSVTEVDIQSLYEGMKKAGRLEDFLSICKVSMSDLTSLEGGNILVEAYRIDNGKTKSASVSVKAMSKQELKEMIEE